MRKNLQQNTKFRWPFSHVLLEKKITLLSLACILWVGGVWWYFQHSHILSKNQIAITDQYWFYKVSYNWVEISLCRSKRIKPCFWGSIRKDFNVCNMLFYCASWNFCRFLKQKERTLSPEATGILWDVAQVKHSFQTLRRYKTTSVSGP